MDATEETPKSKIEPPLRPHFKASVIRILICVVTGFVSGLPLFILISLLPAWLKEEGVSITLISLLSLAQIPYVWKFLWAPWLDLYTGKAGAKQFGRRKIWILAMSASCLLLTGLLGMQSPSTNFGMVALLSVLLGMSSATLDIAIDAYRREILPDSELGLGNAVHVNAYRISSLVPGSLALVIASMYDWNIVFWVTAFFLLPGILLAFFAKEPIVERLPGSIRSAFGLPFKDFFQKRGWKYAVLVLSFIVLYPLGNSLTGALATVFYLDIGFSLVDIGLVAKQAVLWPAIIGGVVSGFLMIYLGIYRSLLIFGILQCLSVLGFIWLAGTTFEVITAEDRLFLGVVIAVEAFCSALATTAFVAMIQSVTTRRFSATQLALLTSFAALPRAFIGAGSGWIVDNVGWVNYYWLCFLLVIPGIVLVLFLYPRNCASELNDVG